MTKSDTQTTGPSAQLLRRLNAAQVRRLADERAHIAAQIAQLKHALQSVKTAIETSATDVVWMQGPCPETACDFIASTLETINDVAF